jgi:hypothetical protein
LDDGDATLRGDLANQKKKYLKWGLIGGAVLIVVILAIVLPLTVGGGGKPPTPPTPPAPPPFPKRPEAVNYYFSSDKQPLMSSAYGIAGQLQFTEPNKTTHSLLT